MKSKLAWGAVATVALIGSGAVSAAVPSADGTFDGCVNNATGVVRVVDATKPGNLGQCITTGPSVLRETAITWSQHGPIGPQGPAGAPGEPGPQGVPGPPGADGHAAAPLELRITPEDMIGERYRYTAAGILIVRCSSTSYDVLYQLPQPGLTPADLWIDRAETGELAHEAVPVTAVHEPTLHPVVRGGVADAHLTLRASAGAAVTNWEVWATTEGGCRVNITETTGSY